MRVLRNVVAWIMSFGALAGCHIFTDYKLDADAGSADTDTDTDTDTDADTDTDVDTDTDTDTDSDTDTDVDSDTDTDTDSDSDTDTDTYPENCVRYVRENADADSGNGMTWETAFPHVQKAIDEAANVVGSAQCPDSSEVWVAMGQYEIYDSLADGTPGDDCVTLKDGVHVFGGFAGDETSKDEADWLKNVTILNGANGTGGNVLHVVQGSDDSTLDGFVVINGYAGDGSGGGMLIEGVSPTVRNCVFSQNGAANSGGGVSILTGSPVFEDCIFANNHVDNSGSRGGGLWAQEASVEITSCTFISNNSGAGGGGLGVMDSSVQVTNSVFAGNTATDGGAVFAQGSQLHVLNSTVQNNYASSAGGGLFNFSESTEAPSDATITSSIFWNNPESELADDGQASTTTVSYSTVMGGWSGPGELNLNSDPGFIDSLRYDGQWRTPPSPEPIPNKFQTLLTANKSLWYPGQLKGLLVQPESPLIQHYAVLGNTYDNLRIWGNIDSISNGQAFKIIDPHLGRMSPCIDTAKNEGAPSDDIEDFERWNSAVHAGLNDEAMIDMGAYEYRPEPSLLFVTSGSFQGDLVAAAKDTGVSLPSEDGLSAANALCQLSAVNAGLPGQFIAVIELSGYSVFDNITDSMGPWALLDGAPVADTVDELASSFLRFPVNMTELGDLTSAFSVWTGADSTNNCNDWDVPQAADNGAIGMSDYASLEWLWSGAMLSCSEQAHLYCIQVGVDAGDNFAPPDPSDRMLAFVTAGLFTGDLVNAAGNTDDPQAAADYLCQTEASAAGMSDRTFMAWISTSALNALNKLNSASQKGPWYSADGFLVAYDLADLVDGDGIQSTFPYDINGEYLGGHVPVWTGTNTSGTVESTYNCSDFQSENDVAGNEGMIGLASLKNEKWTSESTLNCSVGSHLYCFEVVE